jgi:hypothetical protein
MKLTFQAVQVANGHDEEGRLVLAEGRLIAVLVPLSGLHEEQGVAGQWFLETGYGRGLSGEHPTFSDLSAAAEWIQQQLERSGQETS